MEELVWTCLTLSCADVRVIGRDQLVRRTSMNVWPMQDRDWGVRIRPHASTQEGATNVNVLPTTEESDAQRLMTIAREHQMKHFADEGRVLIAPDRTLMIRSTPASVTRVGPPMVVTLLVMWTSMSAILPEALAALRPPFPASTSLGRSTAALALLVTQETAIHARISTSAKLTTEGAPKVPGYLAGTPLDPENAVHALLVTKATE